MCIIAYAVKCIIAHDLIAPPCYNRRMSDISDTPIDMRAILAKIDRDLAESSKLREEANKFQAEQQKLFQEARKYDAEHDKLRRDRHLAPWLIVASLSGGIIAAAIGQIAQHFWR
jgi:hypothetical protein